MYSTNVAGCSKNDCHSVCSSHCTETYGGFFLIGCNGRLPGGDKGRKCSKFILVSRDVPNGLKQASAHRISSPKSSEPTKATKKFIIRYIFSNEESVLVDYASDKETDMFQIGRSDDNDFPVLGKIAEGKGKARGSTVAKYSCRVLANRANKSEVRIYAAGFDSNKEIVLEEKKAVKWKKGSDTNVDALTFNGVLLNNPEGSFCGGELEAGVWREVSVCGNILSLRGVRSSHEKGREINTSTNLLRDGSLVDLCGATLLWRSAEGLQKCINENYIKNIFNKLSESINDVFVIPRKYVREELEDKKQYPHVYLNCGHVHKGRLLPEDCPSCQVTGPHQNLCMGMEFAFYVDDVNDSFTPELYAFIPCGHIATEKTVKFWARTPLPHGKSGYQSICPFCGTALQGYPGYIHLKFCGGST